MEIDGKARAIDIAGYVFGCNSLTHGIHIRIVTLGAAPWRATGASLQPLNTPPPLRPSLPLPSPLPFPIPDARAIDTVRKMARYARGY